MERGKGLIRRTPLAPGSRGLSRSAPLATRTGALARRAPTGREREPRVAPEVRDTVLARSGGRCEVAASPECRARGRRLDVPGIGGNQHHRRPGGMGGSRLASAHEPSNLLQVCGSGNTSGCHGWIETHRTEAYAVGWLLHAGAVPEEEPVLLWDGRRVLLRRAGDVVLAPDDPDPA